MIALLFTLFFTTVTLSFPVMGRAQTDYEDLPGGDDIFAVLERVLDWMFSFSLVLLPIVVVVAGFIFLTAGGDPNRISLAKKILVWGIIGFVVILVAGGVDNVIKDILGM